MKLVKTTSIFVTILFLSLFNYKTYSQEIANCIQVLSQDSLKFYFKPGKLCDKECAEYYRVAKMDNEGYFFNGEFIDFYIDGQILCKGNYKDNELDNEYISYYKTNNSTPFFWKLLNKEPRKQQIREKGKYISGKKIGEWKYYYKNGQLEKKILFYNDSSYFKEYYKKNGKALIKDGNGTFKSSKLLKDVIISGVIKNGKQEGEWKAFSTFTNKDFAVEFFKDGKFIEGNSILNKELVDDREANEQLLQYYGLDSMKSPEKYYDNPYCIIDKSKDLLKVKLEMNINGMINCNYYLPGIIQDRIFFDNIYENLNFETVNNGYMLIGFKFNKVKVINDETYISKNNQKFEKTDTFKPLSDIHYYSTLNNKSFESKIINIISNYKPYKYDTIEKNFYKLLVVYFSGNSYEIINDSKNDYYPVDEKAKYKYGNQAFIKFVISNLSIPKQFAKSSFTEALTFSFSINENGKIDLSNNNYALQKKPEYYNLNERILFESIKNTLHKTIGDWVPAKINGIPVKFYYTGIINIINGKIFFRFFDNHVNISSQDYNSKYRIKMINK